MRVITPLPVCVVDRLIVPGKWPIADGDPLEPFNGRHRVPARHDGAHWKTVLWRQIFAIHLVGQQHIATRFFQRNAARKLQFARRTLRIFEHSAVGSFENYFACVWFRDRSIKQRRKWYSGPLRGADRTQVPLHAFHFRLEKIPVVPGAFQSHRSRY